MRALPAIHSSSVIASLPVAASASTLHEAPIWQGFSLRWDQHPHRISRFGSLWRPLEESTAGLQAEQVTDFGIGIVEDKGEVMIRGQYVQSARLGFAHGSQHLTLNGTVGQAQHVRVREEVDLAARRLDAYDHIVPILRGFHLHSESYDKGYNTRGFWVALSPREIQRGGRIYSFDVQAGIHPEHAPDRPLPPWFFGLGDRFTGTEASHYSYPFEIFYTLVGYNEGGAHSAALSNRYRQTVRMAFFKNLGLVDARTRTLATSQLMPATTDGWHLFPALQGFLWRLEPWRPTRKDGRYLRELLIDVGRCDYDRARARAELSTDMLFDNQGAWPFGYTARYQMGLSLIQFHDPKAVVSQSRTFKEAIISQQGTITKGRSWKG